MRTQQILRNFNQIKEIVFIFVFIQRVVLLGGKHSFIWFEIFLGKNISGSETEMSCGILIRLQIGQKRYNCVCQLKSIWTNPSTQIYFVLHTIFCTLKH